METAVQEELSGRAIQLRQEQGRKQFIIDCSLAMRPAWEAAMREMAERMLADMPDLGQGVRTP
jgi:hypothetical protein